VMVQHVSGDARSDCYVEVFRVIVRYLIHTRQVQAEAAVQSRYAGLQASASAVWNDGHVLRGAQLA